MITKLGDAVITQVVAMNYKKQTGDTVITQVVAMYHPEVQEIKVLDVTPQ